MEVVSIGNDHMPVEEGAHELIKLECNEILKTEIFSLIKPESRWSFGEQAETRWIDGWRAEPLGVARPSDDLSKGVKS